MTPDTEGHSSPTRRPFPMPAIDTGKRIILFLFLIVQFCLLAAALWPTCWLFATYGPRATTPTHWVFLILGAVLVFNYAYLIALLALRIVIPKPKEGFFPRRSDGRPPPEALVYMLNMILVKARYQTPWAKLISSVIVSLFPLDPLFRRFFGPYTRSVTMGDTYVCLDPYLVEAGEGVQFGFGCVITAHVFTHRGLYIRRVKIGEQATIGGESMIMAGAEVGHHATVAIKSLVLPDTVINPYEYWAGTPAKKIKDIDPHQQVQLGDT